MSGKCIRAIMTAVLLALVMTIYSPAKVVLPPAHAAAPAVIMAEEYGTTAS